MKGIITLLTTLFVLVAMVFGAPILVTARITHIEITRVESPTFEGMSFGDVGQYEKLVGLAFGEVDPTGPHNRVITDIALAPRNVRGMVEYATNFYILRPIDRSAGNHRIFFELPNRGVILSLGQLNDAPTVFPPGIEPKTAADAGNGFLMRRGYTILMGGWDATVAPFPGALRTTVPIAANPGGSPIVGPALEEFVIDNAMTLTGGLTYPTATLDKSKATLTVRVLYEDLPTPVPTANWEYVNSRTIRLLDNNGNPTPFKLGRLYEFTYQATNPLVVGLGFAAVRDLTAFLHYATTDDFGHSNPLGGDVQYVFAFGVSQPARFLHDFLHLGFNKDENGEPVFDGILNWIGPTSLFFNYRFAQPTRTARQHIGRWYPELQFPFTDQVLFDPVTGKTDGWLLQCLCRENEGKENHQGEEPKFVRQEDKEWKEYSGCPKIFEVDSANEYWSKAGSLFHTDTLGNDLADPPNVRHYLLSSLPHSAGIGPTGPGICQQPRNPLVANPVLRALLVALDEWVSFGKHPPESEVPRHADRTLVPSLPQSGVGFPNIPGVNYNGRLHTGDLFDFGPLFDQGILTLLPPVLLGSPYPVFVPKTDGDGNDIAGIRLPDVAVPLATYTGWGLRAGPAAGDGCDEFGQKIDFLQTKAERLAAGDPRPSIEERYPNHWKYVSEVAHAANRLHDRRLLLDEDVEQIIEKAATSSIGK